MNKAAFMVLGISVSIDFLMGFGGALTASMLATGAGELPNWSSIIVASLTGLTAMGRSLQPVLKSMLRDFGISANGETSAVAAAAAKVA